MEVINLARITNREDVYDAAERFRQNCLIDGRSLLWPNDLIWTPANVSALLDAFMGHPDDGDRDFLTKWEDQLSAQPVEIHKLAADILTFYYLFLTNVTSATKKNRLSRVFNWKLRNDPPDIDFIDRTLDNGIGSGGLGSLTGQPWQIAFYLNFALEALSGGVDPLDRADCHAASRKVQDRLSRAIAARNILLHLLFPDYYERIASSDHKSRIVSEFSDLADNENDLDDAIFNIRRNLEQKSGSQIDFYQQEIRSKWGFRWWIEKTIVSGRPDRESGELALGKMLWSPKRSKSGSNIYASMRQGSPGDFVLHLVDNQAFVGISQVTAKYEEFGGVTGTEWGEVPSYKVQLNNFHKLDPPLHRDEFFGGPYAERLKRILDSGSSQVFYNRKLDLNQGRYLSEATRELVNVLDDAYNASSGRRFQELLEVEEDLFEEDLSKEDDGTTLEKSASQYKPVDLEAIADSIRKSGLRIEDRILRRYHASVWSKGFVILSGVSGTGKTWLAEEYADAIGGEKLLVPVAPNWTTNEDLLGYQNPLNDDYHHTSFSNFLKSASSEWKSCQDSGTDPRPYFLILDEMNLARIEFYFALFLSKLEVMHRGGRPMIELGAESVELTPNLKVIGTINVDETTQMFSDKVYDRSQLIELPVSRDEISSFIGDKPYRQDLMRIWDAVSEIAPFAYRVVVEIEAYWHQSTSVGNSSEEALDEQLLQKVLPKIRGMDPRIKTSLESISEITRDKYQLTFEKAQVMLDSFTQNGIASYFA